MQDHAVQPKPTDWHRPVPQHDQQAYVIKPFVQAAMLAQLQVDDSLVNISTFHFGGYYQNKRSFFVYRMLHPLPVAPEQYLSHFLSG